MIVKFLYRGQIESCPSIEAHLPHHLSDETFCPGYSKDEYFVSDEEITSSSYYGEWEEIFALPIVVLENGLVIGNFCSPHPFTFDCGSALAGTTTGRTNGLSVEPVEICKLSQTQNSKFFTDVELSFRLTDRVVEQLKKEQGLVDIMLVSLPILTALKTAGLNIGNARTVRVDRVSKICSSTKFCK